MEFSIYGNYISFHAVLPYQKSYFFSCLIQVNMNGRRKVSILFFLPVCDIYKTIQKFPHILIEANQTAFFLFLVYFVDYWRITDWLRWLWYFNIKHLVSYGIYVDIHIFHKITHSFHVVVSWVNEKLLNFLLFFSI